MAVLQLDQIQCNCPIRKHKTKSNSKISKTITQEHLSGAVFALVYELFMVTHFINIILALNLNLTKYRNKEKISHGT